MNLAGFRRMALVDNGPEQSNSDAYTNLTPGVDTNTGETTPEKDKYEGVPGSHISLTQLLKVYPGLKDRMKEIYKQFQRPNWTNVKPT